MSSQHQQPPHLLKQHTTNDVSKDAATFSQWINSRLKENPQTKDLSVSDLFEDVKSGVILCNLYKILSQDSSFTYNPTPKTDFHMMDNLQKVINQMNDYLEKQNANCIKYSAETVFHKSETHVLGLLWQFILRFDIKEISEDGRSGEDALLYWCQKQTKNYSPLVNIVDFGKSFQDGLAFCALIHSYNPQLIDFKAQTELKDPKQSLETSFEIAEKCLNIPKLLNANDLLNGLAIDERIVMTYVSNFWKVMSPTAARKNTMLDESALTTNTSLKSPRTFISKKKQSHSVAPNFSFHSFIEVGLGVSDVRIDYKNQLILVTDYEHNRITIYDLESKEFKAFFETPSTPRYIAVCYDLANVVDSGMMEQVSSPRSASNSCSGKTFVVISLSDDTVRKYQLNIENIKKKNRKSDDEIATCVWTCGTKGRAVNQFDIPLGVAVNHGLIYVCDFENNRIQVLDAANGVFKAQLGRYGQNKGQFYGPHDIDVDSNGNLVVAECWNNRIQVVSRNDGSHVTFVNGNHEVFHPRGVTVDRTSGNVIVSEYSTHKIKTFSSDGKLLSTFEGDQQNFPYGMCVNEWAGELLVADYGHGRIQIYK
ncbi:hypothetical protein C9374_006278 [Naegleria lovaniensis]|uniref:Calponin-homology (CH) domain-containing protein n=1 Tax=Naegleria lovaniensis TaxID=51637 RepID=A0AA88KH22_NAELO|nr:uncharacterized protein C9374_006278 [Naegleria lovaniensis]KAG2381289.1 hypothetical protein C9374_006278 [Naegleria lovaniensis]